MTEIYTNDLLRFGSDVLDKSRQVTQKCVICKVRLFHPDGSECTTRPAASRLYRPGEPDQEFQDVFAVTASLQVVDLDPLTPSPQTLHHLVFLSKYSIRPV